MKKQRFVEEQELATLAKQFRIAAKKTKVQVALEMGVKPPSIHHAEESPHLPYNKLRRRMIETYSNLTVSGPFFRIDEK